MEVFIMGELVKQINVFVNRSNSEIEQLRMESISIAENAGAVRILNAFWDAVLMRKEKMA